MASLESLSSTSAGTIIDDHSLSLATSSNGGSMDDGSTEPIEGVLLNTSSRNQQTKKAKKQKEKTTLNKEEVR